MSYTGPNQPLTPIDNPYQMFGKLYGQVKDRESLRSILDGLQDDLKKIGSAVSAEDRRLLDEHATFVREMERELKDADAHDVDTRTAAYMLAIDRVAYDTRIRGIYA